MSVRRGKNQDLSDFEESGNILLFAVVAIAMFTSLAIYSVIKLEPELS